MFELVEAVDGAAVEAADEAAVQAAAEAALAGPFKVTPAFMTRLLLLGSTSFELRGYLHPVTRPAAVIHDYDFLVLSNVFGSPFELPGTDRTGPRGRGG